MGSDSRKGLKLHPTVKPVVMLVDVMHDLTLPGEIVLDPFLGSGSTLIAADKCSRVCCGLELDPRYVDVILQRYHAVTGREGHLEETGESFTELTRRRTDQRSAPAPAIAGPTLRPVEVASGKGRPRPARRLETAA